MCFKCSDPWVDSAIRQAKQNMSLPMGCGNCGECNIYLYNGGHWTSYSQLTGYVNSFFRTLGNNRLEFKFNGRTFLLGRSDILGHTFAQPTLILPPAGPRVMPLAVDLVTGRTSVISQDGGGLIGQDGSGVISHNGSALVSTNGSTLRANNSSKVLTGNTGSILVNNGANLVGKTRNLFSTNGITIPLGTGKLVLA